MRHVSLLRMSIAGVCLALGSGGAWAANGLPKPADTQTAATTAMSPVVVQPATVAPPKTPDTQAPSTTSKTTANSTFENALQKLMPLTPAEILQTEKNLDATRAAIHSQPPPVMQTRSLPIDITPGAPVPVVDITPGYVSSIVFLDATGEPWPITSATVGNPSSFSVVAPKVSPQNLLTVAATGSHLASNIAVTLEGDTLPIVVTLETNPARAAVLTVLRANAPGPLAKSPIFEGGETVGADPTLLAFLDDVPPKGAKLLQSNRDDVEGWIYKGNLYLRTKLDPVWPAWIATVRGVLGTQVFKLPDVESVLVVDKGQRASIDFTEGG